MSLHRRDFITLLGGAAAWPLAARAQLPKVPVIGFLHSNAPELSAYQLDAFRKGLSETGFAENRNVTIEYRFAQYDDNRLPGLAADLADRRVSVIVTGGGPASALAAKAATSTIPIVFAFGGDPIAWGLVASLNRPGGNVTGATVITSELGTKRLNLLCDLVPQAAIIGYLYSPTSSSTPQQTADFVAAARVLGRNMVVAAPHSVDDFEPALTDLVARGAQALLVGSQPLFIGRRDRLIPLIARTRIPAIYQARDFTEAGGLASYGGDYRNAFYLGGGYAGRILKGDKPADLPVQQATRFELVLNLKTAKSLGLTIPPGVLAIADEVIE